MGGLLLLPSLLEDEDDDLGEDLLEEAFDTFADVFEEEWNKDVLNFLKREERASSLLFNSFFFPTEFSEKIYASLFVRLEWIGAVLKSIR